ncbi:MAG TPA: energy transducer TonB, partial [Hymenobacter sp.]
MLVKALPATPSKPIRLLLAGACLLAAQASFAQTSFNRWDVTPVTTPTPGKARVKRATTAAPEDQKEKVQEQEKAQALVQRRTQDSLQLAKGQSVTLRRGLGQRLRQSAYSKEDAGYYDFAWQNLQYPPTALRAGLTGQVIVRLEVGPDGDVTNSVVTGDDIHQNARPE